MITDKLYSGLLILLCCLTLCAADNFTQCQRFGRCFQVCDSAASCLDIPSLPSNGDYIVLSNNAGAKMQISDLVFQSQPPTNWSSGLKIELDSSVQFQSIIGFGGAFTDAATISLATLPAELQQHVLQAYFGSNGARYSVGRVPVGGCDFSTHSYSYINDGDYDLSSFALTNEDTASGGKIDVIHRSQLQSVHPIKLFASVWSAPPFLKVNTTSYIGGTLDPAPRAQTTWARYLSRFISEYEKRGVSFWGLTMQNEPTPLPAFLQQKWDSMFFTPEQSLEFIRDYFGPILREDHPNVKLMIHDDQALFLMAFLKTVLSDPKVFQYIDGVAVHWYQMPTLNGGAIKDACQLLHSMNLSHVFVLASEACTGFSAILSPPKSGPDLGNWERGQTYALDILNDLNAGASGWTDWNMLLKADGGPNHANNQCDSSILLDATNTSRVYKQPMYYALAHFSAFIPPGAVRIQSLSSGGTVLQPNMECTAFTKDGITTLVVLNRDYFFGRSFHVHDKQRGYAEVSIPPASMMTIVFDTILIHSMVKRRCSFRLPMSFQFTFRTLSGSYTIDVLQSEDNQQAVARYFNVESCFVSIQELNDESVVVILDEIEIHHDPTSETYKCPPGFLRLYETYSNKIRWDALSTNPAKELGTLLFRHKHSLDWHAISRNPSRAGLLSIQSSSRYADWPGMAANPNAIELIADCLRMHMCSDFGIKLDTLDWHLLSANPGAIELLSDNVHKIQWDALSGNPNAIKLLAANCDKIDWSVLSSNPSAIDLLSSNLDKVDWHRLSANANAIQLLSSNVDKVDWSVLSANLNAIEILAANTDKVDWTVLSANRNAVGILSQNVDKIDWNALSANPKAIALLKANQDKINWSALSRNQSAMELLLANRELIDWKQLSGNPGAGEFMRKDCYWHFLDWYQLCLPVAWTEYRQRRP